MAKNKKQYIFLVMGPQGSGKGTQAKLLARKFSLKHFSSGDELRRMAEQKTVMGRMVKKTIDSGKLVPWQWIIKMAREQLKKISKHNGFIFDGLSRRLPEAKAFLRMIKGAKREVNAVFLIDISAKETVRRLSRRWICAKGHILIAGTDLKKNQKKCPKCGSDVFQRKDDTPIAIRKRLKDYRQKTIPAVNYFKKEGLLIKINGQQPVRKVFSDILKEIKKLGK